MQSVRLQLCGISGAVCTRLANQSAVAVHPAAIMESHGGDIVTKAASGVSEQSARSLRFTLELTPSSDRDFPEFSYAELVQQVSTKSESRRRKAVGCVLWEGTC